MSDFSSQINEARQQGYSDDEILGHLASRPDLAPKIKEAQDNGYQPAEILGHLAPAPGQVIPTAGTTGPIGTQTPHPGFFETLGSDLSQIPSALWNTVRHPFDSSEYGQFVNAVKALPPEQRAKAQADALARQAGNRKAGTTTTLPPEPYRGYPEIAGHTLSPYVADVGMGLLGEGLEMPSTRGFFRGAAEATPAAVSEAALPGWAAHYLPPGAIRNTVEGVIALKSAAPILKAGIKGAADSGGGPGPILNEILPPAPFPVRPSGARFEPTIPVPPPPVEPIASELPSGRRVGGIQNQQAVQPPPAVVGGGTIPGSPPAESTGIQQSFGKPVPVTKGRAPRNPNPKGTTATPIAPPPVTAEAAPTPPATEVPPVGQNIAYPPDVHPQLHPAGPTVAVTLGRNATAKDLAVAGRLRDMGVTPETLDAMPDEELNTHYKALGYKPLGSDFKPGKRLGRSPEEGRAHLRQVLSEMPQSATGDIENQIQEKLNATPAASTKAQ